MPEADRPSVLTGCEPRSHAASGAVGALLLHGFTGCPASMYGIADVLAADDVDLEVPRLPGHGTTIDDMLTTSWADWSGAVDDAYRTLAGRCDRVVAVGQSMGGTLALTVAARHPELAGVVCINPVTRLRDPDTMEMIDELIDDGIRVAPGEGSDIADPDAVDVSYPGTPLAPLRSLLVDGVAPITYTFDTMTMPLRLLTSRHDHVVDPADSEHLAASWGGPVEHTWLERSFHVATRDYDRHLVHEASATFVRGCRR